MDRLSRCLHFYAHNKLNNNPAWKDLKIIISDANVPGEGEHKIMDFIRKQRGIASFRVLIVLFIVKYIVNNFENNYYRST